MAPKLNRKEKSRHCNRLLNLLNNDNDGMAKDVLLHHIIKRLKRVKKNTDSKSADSLIKGLNKLFPEDKMLSNTQNLKHKQDEIENDDDMWEII